MAVATGKVVNWKPERGYGFITPEGGGQDVFLHVAELEPDTPAAEVRNGVVLEYRVVEGSKGPKAMRVTRWGLPAGEGARFALAQAGVPSGDGECDVLTTDEYHQEVRDVLGTATAALVALARRHNWVEEG